MLDSPCLPKSRPRAALVNAELTKVHVGQVVSALKASHPAEHYKFEEVDLKDVAYLMVGDDPAKVERDLDDIRRKRNKFICLNDNMNAKNPNPKVLFCVVNRQDVRQHLHPERIKFLLIQTMRSLFFNSFGL